MGFPVRGWTPMHSTLTSSWPSGPRNRETVARTRGLLGSPPDPFGKLISWKSESNRPCSMINGWIGAAGDLCARITSPALPRLPRRFLLRSALARSVARRDPHPMSRSTTPRAAVRTMSSTEPRPTRFLPRLGGSTLLRAGAPQLLRVERGFLPVERCSQPCFQTGSGGAFPRIARVRRPTLRTCERTTVVRSGWSRSSACG